MSDDPKRITGVEIRQARAQEATELTRIAHAAKRHWGYPEEWIASWKDDLTIEADACAAGSVACACVGSEIRGFYALSSENAVFSLEHMWVEPAFMGMGVGALLFRHAVRTAGALGGKILEIASDPNAEGFYLRMGARRTGEVPSSPAGRSLPLLVVDLQA